MKLLMLSLVFLVPTAAAQSVSSSYELYLASPETRLYYSAKCDEAKRMVRRLEFVSPEAAEAKGFKPGNCTVTRPDRQAESLYDSLHRARPGALAVMGLGSASDGPEPLSDWSGDCSGRLVDVADGDTVTILNSGNKQIMVRLAGIDAPEVGQAFGEEAKSQLSKLILGRHVRCEAEKRDRAGKAIGKILLDGTDVNLLMVRTCLAWHYKRHEGAQSRVDRAAYAKAEAFARDGRCGIFQDVNPTPPWAHRRTDGADRQNAASGATESRTPFPPMIIQVGPYIRKGETRGRPYKQSSRRN